MQSGLLDAMHEVREIGYEIALHTNGFFPDVVEKAIEQRLLQFIAVDYKAPIARYGEVTGQSASEKSFGRVAELIVASGIRHEYRTTFHPRFISEKELMTMADWLVEKKISSFALQKFKWRRLRRLAAPVIGPGYSTPRIQQKPLRQFYPAQRRSNDLQTRLTGIDFYSGEKYKEGFRPLYHPNIEGLFMEISQKDLNIQTLGKANFDSPLKLSTVDGDYLTNYVKIGSGFSTTTASVSSKKNWLPAANL